MKRDSINIREKLAHGTKWGDWWLDTSARSLVLNRNGRERYAVPLEDITDSAHMLDWTFQIRKKAWVTNEIVGELLSAFQDIFRPQATLCGEGRNKTLDTRTYLDAVLRR